MHTCSYIRELIEFKYGSTHVAHTRAFLDLLKHCFCIDCSRAGRERGEQEIAKLVSSLRIENSYSPLTV